MLPLTCGFEVRAKYSRLLEDGMLGVGLIIWRLNRF